MEIPYQGRASLWHMLRVLQRAVLLAVVLGNGCRKEEPVNVTPSPVDLHLKLVPGGSYTYDTWVLDRYGSSIPSTKSRRLLNVADTGIVYRGFSNVALLIDSTFYAFRPGVDSLEQVDSVYLRVSPGGDIYWFGFLAGLIEKREGIILTQEWDTVVSPSSGQSSWRVGTTDSAAVETAFGAISTTQERIAVTVNGVAQTAMAYRVDIVSPRLECTLWVADDPSGFLRFREESDAFENIPGSFREITFVVTPGP